MRDIKITGLMIYYYFVCKRKLWFSTNNLDMESENENVAIGKFIDENSYKRDRKHILINDEINIDFIKSNGTIHEIKKSRKIEEASIWQVKYYLYYLEKLGISEIEAKIDYPLLKKVVEVELNGDDREKLKKVIGEIKMLLESSVIPKEKMSEKCKKCAYYDICII
ncbi:CRISPR-associated protein Cas4 [Alkalibaculum bacchi]|uniref:CRISPR-associated protein Cas4 n=1 Tax=Alkalibaculum bacchi TaxID=645887 RepID=UPI0026EAE1A8|nr:CRISPR-associated protein Cas4 [Alkalibaculum bacchi]